MLHDIGKIAIPSAILKKPNTELTPEETKIFHQHVIYGARLFHNVFSTFEEIARAITLNHHEHWDGSGYLGHVRLEDGLPLPGYEKADGSAFGKSGNEIPIYARVVAVANAYDEEKTVEKILANSGKKFDPDVVAAFIGCLEVINSIRNRYPD